MSEEMEVRRCSSGWYVATVREHRFLWWMWKSYPNALMFTFHGGFPSFPTQKEAEHVMTQLRLPRLERTHPYLR